MIELSMKDLLTLHQLTTFELGNYGNPTGERAAHLHSLATRLDTAVHQFDHFQCDDREGHRAVDKIIAARGEPPHTDINSDVGNEDRPRKEWK